MWTTGDEADPYENMFHLPFRFHANKDSCTKTRFETEAKATREWPIKHTYFLTPRLEWSYNFLHTFIFLQHDCQLTGCLNPGSWEFIEVSKLFKRKCKDAWSGNYCAGAVFIIKGGGVDGFETVLY